MDNNRNLRIKYKNMSLGFFIIFIVCMFAFVYSLRSNYSRMVNLRNTLYSVDQNNGDVKTALNNLRTYVTSHMNTDLTSGNTSVYPPIQLEYTYQRIVQSKLGSQDNNTKLYTDAENYCQSQITVGFSGKYRIPCVENYINTHSLTKINVDPSLYEFAFISPSFSFDLAGLSMIAVIISASLTLLYLVSYLIRR